MRFKTLLFASRRELLWSSIIWRTKIVSHGRRTFVTNAGLFVMIWCQMSCCFPFWFMTSTVTGFGFWVVLRNIYPIFYILVVYSYWHTGMGVVLFSSISTNHCTIFFRVTHKPRTILSNIRLNIHRISVLRCCTVIWCELFLVWWDVSPTNESVMTINSGIYITVGVWIERTRWRNGNNTWEG